MACALMLVFCAVLALSTGIGEAAQRNKILYIPIDDRPVNQEQVLQVVEKLGYQVLVPPAGMVGTWNDWGHPEKLWEWLESNAPGARAAVVSTDAMLYGSLVGSRNHSLSKEEIMERAKRFQAFHDRFPRLPVYALGTIMRTPRSGSNAGKEPAYYQEYGAMIFRCTALQDKAETDRLSHREKRELRRLEQQIPSEYMDDWMERRAKNFDATAYLTELARQKAFSYFLLGCDDSAVYSQTHRESRYLEQLGKDIGKTRYQVTSGADELGMLMIGRAINDLQFRIPFLYVQYNEGKGENTVPTYANERIGTSIDAAIRAVGAFRVSAPERADLVLAVNTNPNGKTPEASSPSNGIRPRKGTKLFMAMVKDFVGKGYPVGVADIAFGNGADNALMEQLRKEDLQFKLSAYGGWNTATNSSGFLIGAGVLTQGLARDDLNDLLLTRYLDDWGYQANVRQALSGELWGLLQQKEGIKAANARVTEELSRFAQEHIAFPSDHRTGRLEARLPWHRAFECSVKFGLPAGTDCGCQ